MVTKDMLIVLLNKKTMRSKGEAFWFLLAEVKRRTRRALGGGLAVALGLGEMMTNGLCSSFYAWFCQTTIG